MHRYSFRLIFLLLSLGLTACAPSRQEADSKLAAACGDSIKATFQDPKEHITIQNASFSFEKSYDDVRLRAVTLQAQYTYGDSEPEKKTYLCRYNEEWSLFSYLPEFYNLERDDVKFGNYGGTIAGDTNVLLQITQSNQKILK